MSEIYDYNNNMLTTRATISQKLQIVPTLVPCSSLEKVLDYLNCMKLFLTLMWKKGISRGVKMKKLSVKECYCHLSLLSVIKKHTGNSCS